MANVPQLNLDHNVYSSQTLFGDVKFFNVEYYFYKFYLFLQRIFGGGSRSSSGVGTTASSTSPISLTSGGGVSPETVMRTSAAGINFTPLINVIESLLYFFIILFLTVIIYSWVSLYEVRKKENAYMADEIANYAKKHKEAVKTAVAGDVSRNAKWRAVLEHLYSENPANWKLAVMEADEVLFDLMREMNFPGESLGEKLKSANRENFAPLTIAWEVHTVRNRIAHEGASYELPQREAKRVIALYESIFREYGYI